MEAKESAFSYEKIGKAAEIFKLSNIWFFFNKVIERCIIIKKEGDNLGYVEFKSKFINQFAKYENTKRKISLFKSALDRAVEQELPLRDSYQRFQIRDIYNSKGLNVGYNSPNLMCKYSKEKRSLLVGTLTPAW